MKSSRHHFTLVELLVIIAIIATLGAALLGGLSCVRRAEKAQREPALERRPKILVAISSNRGHAWHYFWSGDSYEKYLLKPLRAKLGDRLLTCHHKCTPQNVSKTIAEHNPALFVWIGGGLDKHGMELDAEEHIGGDFTPCRYELDLSGRIAFVNCEFALNIHKKLTGCKAAFGYWTEMSHSLHLKDKYDCDFFPDEVQPMDWYGPYYVLMRRVIEWLADGHTVKEAAAKADALWAGFLDWVKRHPDIPAGHDYIALSQLWKSLGESIVGDPNARLEAAPSAASTGVRAEPPAAKVGKAGKVQHAEKTQREPGQQTGSENLLKNPGFEELVEGLPAFWKLTENEDAFSLDTEVVHSGKHSVHVSSSGFCMALQEVTTIPKGKELVVTGCVKTKRAFATLWINCVDGRGERSYVMAPGVRQVTDWTLVKTHMTIPKDCVKLEVWLYFATAGPAEAWFDDVCLRLPHEHEELPRSFVRKVMKGPGIACAEGCYEFTGHGESKLRIAFPIPQMYEEQVPIYLEFISLPEDAINKVSLKNRKEAPPNWIAEIEFKPLEKGEKVWFNWKGYVLLIAKDYSTLPEQVEIPRIDDLPEEVLPWLRSTKSVQADHKDIQKKAEELRDPNNDLIQTIRRVIAFSTETSRNIKRGRDRPNDCSALTALHWGEICTGSANLAAALLRANGIPARLLANYPVWNTLFATHYFIEAYIPGYGWVRAESIMNVFPVETFRNVIVSIVYPDDEDKSFGNRWCAQGCPYLSLTEPMEGLNVSWRFPWHGGDHVGVPIVEFKGSPKELRTALDLTKEAWTQYLERRAKGEQNPRAMELQKKATAAKDLTEYLKIMREAEHAYE